jgi:uncharacterized protein
MPELYFKGKFGRIGMKLNCVAVMCLICIILLPVVGYCDEKATIYTAQVEQLRKAATAGDTLAQFNLGTLYLQGLGVREDDAEAEKWFLRAAEQGYAPAQVLVGMIYSMDGKGFNYAEAAKWYLKAAEQGDKPAQVAIGEMYEFGQGVKKDDAEAMKWYLKAAEHGNGKAQYHVGVGYVKKDKYMAKEWLKKACDNGYKLGCEQYRILTE